MIVFLAISTVAVWRLALDDGKVTIEDILKVLHNGKVLNIEKKVNKGVTGLEKEACNRFRLTEDDIKRIWARSHLVTDEEYVMLYQSLPCDVYGEVENAGIRLKFAVNAGATTVLFLDNKKELKLGCGQECNDILDFGLYRDPQL